MATKTTAAFLAGVAAGWTMRSVLGSSREAIVRAIVLAHEGRDKVRRMVGERVEWLDDLLAEGRARYEAASDEAPLDEEAPPHVDTDADAREHAA
jgi:hypothetical protein